MDPVTMHIFKINKSTSSISLHWSVPPTARVTTLSDITLADGVTLDPHMRSGNIYLLSSTTKQLSAKQDQPNVKSWKLWSKCMKPLASNDQLKVPLHQWLVPTTELQSKWPIYLDYKEEVLYA
eukprot:9180747-Ditylum_brightwellii.AAC.1